MDHKESNNQLENICSIMRERKLEDEHPQKRIFKICLDCIQSANKLFFTFIWNLRIALNLTIVDARGQA